MRRMINYGDGNGNEYIIKQDSIEYNPIKPKFSSSGIYDGGEYVIKTITQQQYNTIASIIKDVMVNEANHIKNRVKGSGSIIMQEDNTISSCILNPHSEKLNQIERLLKELIT